MHLALEVEEQLEAGVPLREAKLAAQRELGSVTLAKEELRDMRTGAALERLGRELRHSARRLVRSPAFTLATVLTLALAIGANASIFAVVHGVVLNPLPYPDSDRLIDLDHAAPGINAQTGTAMTIGLYYHYRERARTLEGLALYRTAELTLTGNGEPERVRGTRATTTLASVLRVQPVLGRWFTEEDGVPGTALVAVLSRGLWMRRYGGDTGILGRSVTLQGVPMEVIGVMAGSFAFPDPRVDVWVPEQITRTMLFDDFSYVGVARLRDGVTVAAARAELTGLIADLPSAYPDDRAVSGLVNDAKLMSKARTVKEAMVGRVTAALWILLASVGIVLLVACANVATLFLVRAEARQREVAVRRALGAGGAGIARLFLAESLLLSIAGGIVGLALAWGAVRLLVRVGPSTLPRLEEVRLDWTAVAFTFALSLLAALAFGIIPLLRGTPLASSLHESGRSNTASRGRHRVRQCLMGGQVALALVLLVASGLMVRSFQTLRSLDPGFNPTSALTFHIGLPEREYAGRRTVVAGHYAILDRLSALPGVTAVSTSTCLPLASNCLNFPSPLRVEGRTLPEGTIRPLVAYRAVAGRYIETMGMRLIRGRTIDRRDIEQNEPVVVVNEALVNVFFPNQDPIGARVARGTNIVNPAWLTIVGVVSNTPVRALAEVNATPQLYMPMSISGRPDIPNGPIAGPPVAAMSYVVRSATPPLELLPSVRRAIDEVDANLALAQVRTLEDILDGSSAQMAFTMVLLAIAAGVALMLGVIGIYGVMSYIVSQRTPISPVR